MELKNYLRHDYVAKRRYSDTAMMEDQLFDIMQINLAHQLHDKGNYNRLYLPIDMEALGCDDFVMEPELYHLFQAGVDGEKIAEKLIRIMKRNGWQLAYYCEDGQMFIDVEEKSYE